MACEGYGFWHWRFIFVIWTMDCIDLEGTNNQRLGGFVDSIMNCLRVCSCLWTKTTSENPCLTRCNMGEIMLLRATAITDSIGCGQLRLIQNFCKLDRTASICVRGKPLDLLLELCMIICAWKCLLLAALQLWPPLRCLVASYCNKINQDCQSCAHVQWSKSWESNVLQL